MGNAYAKEFRRPIDVEHPLYIFHIDVWNNADPQKVIDLVPESIRPYVVMNISLSVTASVTKDGMRTAESWLRTCAENRLWAFIQPASGGHSWFSDYEFDVYRYFFETYPNFLGFNYAEQFWGFADPEGLHPFGSVSPSIPARMNLFKNLLEIANEYGGYLCISNCLVIPQWDATSPLTMFKRYPEFAAAAKQYKEHLIYCEKYTMAANYYDMESMCLGVFLNDYCGHYGMRFDQCGYNEHVPSGQVMPEAIGGMTILEHMMMQGQTVQDGPELIWQQCIRSVGDVTTSDGFKSRKWEFFPQFPNVYDDVWRKFTTDGVIRILPRQEVIDSTRLAIVNDLQSQTGWEGRRAAEFLFNGLYALEEGTYGQDSCYLKRTGRYPTIPTLFDVSEDLGFQKVYEQSKYQSQLGNVNNKIRIWKRAHRPQIKEEGNDILYVRRQDNNWLVYNNSQFQKQSRLEHATIDLAFNSCDAVRLVMPMLSFGLVTEQADGLDLYLNNYNSSTSAQTTDTIQIQGCTAEPTFEVRERGRHDASTVRSTYINNVLTLAVTHNGPLDILVKCQGAATDRMAVPQWTRTSGSDIPEVYTGPRQYELENADYKNVDNVWNGLTCSDIPGFTALGYARWGLKSNACLRDTVKVDEAGDYKVEIRYLAPSADVNTVDVKVNRRVKASKLLFPKTDADNAWQTVSFEATFRKGKNEIQFVANGAAKSPLYLDNMVLTKVDASSIETLSETPAADVNAPSYDLFGRPVGADHRGFVIRNGKKMIVR